MARPKLTRLLPILTALAILTLAPDPALAQERAPRDSLLAPELESPRKGGAFRRRASDGEFFGVAKMRGSYEVRSLATDSLLGSEDWELFEDDGGFRTLQGTTSLDVDGVRSSRTAAVTVDPELELLEATITSAAGGVEAYAAYRRAGDVLTVEGFSARGGTIRQQVRFPAGSRFASQILATRGWELAPFRRDDDSARPVYVTGTAPGVLVGGIQTLRAEAGGRDEITVRAGRFRTNRWQVSLPDEASYHGKDAIPAGEDNWWVLPGSEIPVAAELASLGVRIELVGFEENLDARGEDLPGPVLARGVYHHRPLRQREPVAIESWTLGRTEATGFFLDVRIDYADGRNVGIRALADSLLRIHDMRLRRRNGRDAEWVTFSVSDSAVEAEARGGGVGVVQQRFPVTGTVLFRTEAAALEGWGIPREGAATYWLPAGTHALGALLDLPADVSLGEQRITTPARTFAAQRFASPADTPLLFRSLHWVFGPYRLAARVVFPASGREAILVRYETAEA